MPFGIELRKVLFRFAQVKERTDVRSALMFPAREGEHAIQAREAGEVQRER